AQKYDLKIIEDSCQAHGAEYKTRKLGSLGDIGCFSFYPPKNLGCLGDGGMIVTNNPEIGEKIKLLRDYGQKVKYNYLEIGFNSRLDTIQAATLRIKLKLLDKWNMQRQKKVSLYKKLLSKENYILPGTKDYPEHVWHLFVVRSSNRDSLKAYLKEKDIGTAIHYPVPLHLTPAYSHLGYKKGDFPVAEKLSTEILSLPMYPELTEEEVKYVATTLKQYTIQ
ncbi:unnamed protein product, partial [marine sediment metagenome]